MYSQNSVDGETRRIWTNYGEKNYFDSLLHECRCRRDFILNTCNRKYMSWVCLALTCRCPQLCVCWRHCPPSSTAPPCALPLLESPAPKPGGFLVAWGSSLENVKAQHLTKADVTGLWFADCNVIISINVVFQYFNHKNIQSRSCFTIGHKNTKCWQRSWRGYLY